MAGWYHHVTQLVGRMPEQAGRTVVVVLPDSGVRHLSTALFEA